MTLTSGERFNIFSHLLGVLASTIAFLVLVIPPLRNGEIPKAVCFAVYGTGLIFAFLASILFHSVTGETRALLRRCDRTAIYLLIASHYTPLAYLKLPAKLGIPLIIAAWAFALYGSALEWWKGGRRALHSIGLYIVMGWMSLLFIRPLMLTMDTVGIVLLLSGGMIYTFGAALIRLTRHPLRHEFWHVAVLAASACHFLMMYLYVS